MPDKSQARKFTYPNITEFSLWMRDCSKHWEYSTEWNLLLEPCPCWVYIQVGRIETWWASQDICSAEEIRAELSAGCLCHFNRTVKGSPASPNHVAMGHTSSPPATDFRPKCLRGSSNQLKKKHEDRDAIRSEDHRDLGSIFPPLHSDVILSRERRRLQNLLVAGSPKGSSWVDLD